MLVPVTSTAILEADPLQGARGARFVDLANQKDDRAAKKLAALRSDLHSQQNKLGAQRDEAQRVQDQLDAKNADLQAQLVSAAEADDLIARLEAERAEAANAAELARLRAAQASSGVGGGGAARSLLTRAAGHFSAR